MAGRAASSAWNGSGAGTGAGVGGDGNPNGNGNGNANGNANGNGWSGRGRSPLVLTESVGVNANGNENGNGNGNPHFNAHPNNPNSGDNGSTDTRSKPLHSASYTGHVRIPEHLNRPHLTSNHRTVSDALRAVRSREEQETLLGDDEVADADGCLREDGDARGPREVFCPDPHAELGVYYTIQRIRRLVLTSIDDPYTADQLKEPRMNVLIVRPLVDRLFDPNDVSVVYCLLVNRTQFLREQSFQHNHQTVNLTRANLCEIVAMKMLRKYSEEKTGRAGLLQLAHILVAPFQPFQNAPPEVCPERFKFSYQQQGGYEGKLTALEVAIISESKLFLASSACQKVIDAVYRGRIVYTPTSFLDIIPDHYKHKPISLYDPRKAHILNQYRLVVPRNRNVIEVLHFMILLGLYCFCMMSRDLTMHTNFTTPEILFAVYASGWVLDECASVLEHGWVVHTQELWAFLDLTFVFIFFVYSTMRMHGFTTSNPELGRQALDVLSIAAPILFPRLAFNLMPENMLFISLRAMVKEFTALSLIAVWCFGGFLLALKWLSMGNISNPDFESSPTPITISKWMLWIWFGLDGTGIQQAPRFHEILGPTLMVIYAFLGNTLFLTVLVSILSNTFSKIAAEATAEIQFRRAVTTFEGVKSDSLFLYPAPFNLLAFFVLIPLKFLLTPRWFHKINITLVRILNFPILLAIAWHERRTLWKPLKKPAVGFRGPIKRSRGVWSLFSWGTFSPHADLTAVFEEEPPEELVKRIEEEDEVGDEVLLNSFAGIRSGSPGSVGFGGRLGSVGGSVGGTRRRRRLSSVWQG
ncbi:hypothetical protein B0J11DRAFT_449702 [Dendryphion nanum]|uniref:Nonselective cation channel n=1 Tax=Dendryphion nanum TaxID=256645 RepID=A0A9P9EGS3_9PLEO|nr:hypothetical protein B0J11DRAFT_449702 [Dendryphion nanum]